MKKGRSPENQVYLHPELAAKLMSANNGPGDEGWEAFIIALHDMASLASQIPILNNNILFLVTVLNGKVIVQL